jgi:F-type H+-transporting ATPase subunit b
LQYRMTLTMRLRTLRVMLPVLLVLAGCLLGARPLLAAEGSEGGWGIWLFVGRLFNLAVVVALLVWVARKPLANFYASRSESIREQLAEAQRARAEAEAKLAEIETRMGRLDQELGEMKAAAEKDAELEYKRLVAAADEESRKLIGKAKEEIDGITREAYLDLKAHAAELAVSLAGQKIKSQITDEDRRRLHENFLAGLEDKK